MHISSDRQKLGNATYIIILTNPKDIGSPRLLRTHSVTPGRRTLAISSHSAGDLGAPPRRSNAPRTGRVRRTSTAASRTWEASHFSARRSDAVGHSRIRSDAAGRGRTRSDGVGQGQIVWHSRTTFGHGRMRSETIKWGQAQSDTVRHGRTRLDAVRRCPVGRTLETIR